MVISLERDADLHMAQLVPLPLPLAVFCFSIIWYRPTRVVPDKGPLNVCVCVIIIINDRYRVFRLRGGGGGVCDATLPRSGPAFSVDRRIASCRADSQVIDPFLPCSQCSQLASRRRGNLVATLQRLIYSSRRVLYERQTTYPREHTRGRAALRPQ